MADQPPATPEESLPTPERNGESAPSEPADIIRQMPPDEGGVIERFMGMMYQGPLMNPLASKITSANIDKALDIKELELKLDHEDRHDNRGFVRSIIFGGIILVGALLVILTAMNQAAMALEIIKIVALISGGFGVGYGYRGMKK